MSLHSPRNSQAQFQFSASTPPPPPPKPTASSGHATPTAGPPRPPPPPGQFPSGIAVVDDAQAHNGASTWNVASVAPPQDGWLPDMVKDKSNADLQTLLSTPSLQNALIHAPETCHPSLPASSNALQALLSENLSLTQSLQQLEEQIRLQRASTQGRLLALRAQEAQWRAKQAEQDTALRAFSAPALYQRLAAAVGEQDMLCRGLEESFLEGGESGAGGVANEREVMEFVRRFREARKVAYLRRERRERWDEGRVGGWR